MTGDEIYATEFPLRAGGYDCSSLRQHLSFIADLHDRGLAPRSFTFQPPRGILRSSQRQGYDPEAVDRFLDALAIQAAAAQFPVLPEVRDGSQAPFWTMRARDCHAQWRSVSELPGARLRRTGRTIVGSSGEVLLTRKGRELTLADGHGSPPDLATGLRFLSFPPLVTRSCGSAGITSLIVRAGLCFCRDDAASCSQSAALTSAMPL